MYASIGALAFLEAIIPVVPSDVVAALGAFLAHDGKTTPIAVFLIVTLSNAAGAMLVYALARRAGRRFFATPTGQRLLAPESIAIIERDYLRLGLAGLFVARFIPGVRAVVPPFAGIFGIPAGRTLVVVLLAGSIWYGGIVGLAAFLGSEWEQVRAVISSVGQTTGLIAATLAVAAGIWFWLRRRQPEPVVAAVEAALGAQRDDGQPVEPEHAARLIIEIAYADEGLDEAQRQKVAEDLRRRWGLPARAAGAPTMAAGDVQSRTERLTSRFSVGKRLALVEQMWQAAFAEGTLAPEQEAWLLRRAGELLGLGADEIAAVRRRSTDA